MDNQQIREKVRAYIVSQFLEEEDAAALGDDTPLITSGVLNSLALVSVTNFLKKEFGVQLRPEEMNPGHMDSVNLIASTISTRQ